ncbi:hypothetical protein WMF31_11715 [Sorangium sp. So ce1036]|uniref:hypothetical protein n=1 Tax=Sorangium sp. So ce1036 TaxID=3133328 RepID=UPI003EFFE99D
MSTESILQSYPLPPGFTCSEREPAKKIDASISMFFSASACWYEGRYVAPSGSPSPSNPEQNVALAGHAPVGVPPPAPVVVVVLLVAGSPVPVVALVLLAVVVVPAPVVVVVVPAPVVVVVVPAPVVVVVPAPELTLVAPPAPPPLPPDPSVVDTPSASSEQPVAATVVAVARARQERQVRVKRALSRRKIMSKLDR